MIARLALVSALGGCLAVDYVAHHGSVYECDSEAYAPVELCTDMSAAELGDDLTFAWASPTICYSTPRLWPLMTGCIYTCEPHPGCNAGGGCWCK